VGRAHQSRSLASLAIVLIFGQRFAFGNISLMFFVMYANLLVMIALERQQSMSAGSSSYVIAMSAFCLSMLISQHNAFHYSWPSTVYLGMNLLRGCLRSLRFRNVRFLSQCLSARDVLAAILGILQFLIQFDGRALR